MSYKNVDSNAVEYFDINIYLNDRRAYYSVWRDVFSSSLRRRYQFLRLTPNARVRRQPKSTTATSSKQRRDVSSLSRASCTLNSIAATSSNQTRVKLETSRLCLEEVAVVTSGLQQPVAQGRVGDRPGHQAGIRGRRKRSHKKLSNRLISLHLATLYNNLCAEMSKSHPLSIPSQ
jgi:hypothetical protein